MSNPNVVLTGVPRSGTTLTCHLLNKLPDVVALHEPMRVASLFKLDGREAMCNEIEIYFRKTRKSILKTGMAPSKHTGGQIPDNPFADQTGADGLRKMKHVRGEIVIGKELSSHFMLCVKELAVFTLLLENLVKRFPCFAIIRNPLSALASWNSVTDTKRFKPAPGTEKLEPNLLRAFAGTKDELDRQICALSWYFEKFTKLLPPHAILRYEEIIASNGRALSVITPQAETCNEALENRNRNKLYNPQLMQTLGERLLKSEGAFWQFYSKESLEALLNE